MKDSLLAIYPTARKVADQLMRLSRGTCLLGYRITTLPQIVDALWNESDDDRQSLSPIGERLVMREALARVATEGIGIELTEGIGDRMLALIRRLKSAAIAPDDWSASVATIGAARDRGLAAFAVVFSTYQKLLAERGLADRHDREAWARDLLDRCEQTGNRPRCLEGVERLTVAEIYDLSLLQFMLIAALIRIIGDAELTIQAGPHHVDLQRFADLTWNRFVGEESIADKVLPEFVRREGRTGRLGFLLERIFTGAAIAPPAPDDSVTLVQAPDPRAEAEAAARTIQQMRERGGDPLALDRIAIIARDLAPYRDHLEAAFRRYGIPLRIGVGRALRATTPARALQEIIRVPIDHYRREALIALCDSGFTRVAASEYRELPRAIGYIDSSTLALTECIAKHRQLLERLGGKEATERRSALEHKRHLIERGARAWVELVERLKTLHQPGTLPDHLQRLRTLLERLEFDPARDSLHDSAAIAGGALWTLLEELAAAAALVMPDRILKLPEFAILLDDVLSETELESSETAGAAVHALPVMEARGLDFDLVIILGLNDGVFPARHPENPLLTDALVRALNPILRARLRRRIGAAAPDAPGPILRTRSDRNAEEPFLFFLALSMPSRAVVLSCSAEDEQGKPLGRSPFLDEVVRMVGSDQPALAPRRSGALRHAIEECRAEREYLNFAARHGGLEVLADAAAFGGRAASIRRRIAIEQRRADYLARPTREQLFKRWKDENKDHWATPDALIGDRAKARAVDQYDGRVTPDARLTAFLIEGQGDALRAWSASQFTELASCGFKFFARRVLRLREDDDADHEPTRLEGGALVHDILRVIVDAHPNYADGAAVTKLVGEIMGRFEDQGRGAARDPAFFDAEWATIQELISEFVAYETERHAAGDRPAAIETEYDLDFTLAGPRPAGGEPIRIGIKGAIDRLELQRDRADRIAKLRVIDYKTSRGSGLDKLLEPRNFATTDMQMPIYLLGAMAQAGLQHADRLIAEASYLALKRRDKTTAPLVVPIDRIDRKHTTQAPDQPIAIAARVFDLIDGAIAGHFDVDPLHCSEWCAYRALCRFVNSRQP
jgi:hypothetical protein